MFGRRKRWGLRNSRHLWLVGRVRCGILRLGGVEVAVRGPFCGFKNANVPARERCDVGWFLHEPCELHTIGGCCALLLEVEGGILRLACLVKYFLRLRERWSAASGEGIVLLL